ncbi:MAG: NAD(P)-dependent glycerol-3-phosphate dehydrogenase [Candidatus Desulfofervidaceae bacterium]|nr:NAD(P)-dependent glycerol-3-phosphate dehydrogenase [Candidatus Desulfofervidaceae bacterium]
MKSIAVLGAGSWGTALALLLAEKGLRVNLWVHGQETYQTLISQKENIHYLPGIKLPPNIFPTLSLDEALHGQKDILIVVPSHVYRNVLTAAIPYLSPDCRIISATKGIENDTLLTMSGVTKSLLADFSYTYTVLSGPSFAKEVSRRLPTAVTVASTNTEAAIYVQKLFATQYLRAYTHHDVLGVELGGALKNVMAIAAGICDGLGLGHNARAALITRGLVEMTRVGQKIGAEPQTFTGLSGLGDLVLTCTSTLSRNYTVGERLGKGEKIADILNSMRMIAEGVKTSRAAYMLAQRERVDTPIINEVYDILYQGKPPLDGLKQLLARTLKPEFW